MRVRHSMVSCVAALMTVAADGAHAAGPPSSRAESGGTHQLIGRVVRTGPNVVYLEHMGAVVAFKITSGTEFTGLGAKSSRDFAEGQQVLATFSVENETTNLATRISATSEAVGETRSSPPRRPAPPPATPPDVPPPPDHGPVVPRVPPDGRIPRDPTGPIPR